MFFNKSRYTENQDYYVEQQKQTTSQKGEMFFKICYLNFTVGMYVQPSYH